jgi:hypothetical protein
MEMFAAPLTAFTENFSPMPRIAPPPCGRAIRGSGSEILDEFLAV